MAVLEKDRKLSRKTVPAAETRRVRVSGNSMSPLLNDGDIVDVDITAYASRPPQVGDIVLVAHPYVSTKQIIKQITSQPEQGQVFLLGLNPSESTDSRSFGTVPASSVKGKVIV